MARRIVQISDLHIGAKPDRPPSPYQTKGFVRGTKELFRHGLKDTNSNFFHSSSHDSEAWNSFVQGWWLEPAARGDVDALIVTGDIARTGSTDDLQIASEMVYGPAESIAVGFSIDNGLSNNLRVTLNIAGEIPGNAKVVLIPGNHDRYTNSTGLQLNQKFHEYFDQYAINRLPEAFWLKEIANQRKVVVVAFDSCLESGAWAMASEAIGDWYSRGCVTNQIAPLTRLTSELRRQGCVVIWATHHTPHPSLNSAPKFELDGQRLLLAAAKEHSIPLVLGGHHHTESLFIDPSAPHQGVYSAPTLAESGSDHKGFTVWSIDAPEGTDEVVIDAERYRYQGRGAYQFRSEHSPDRGTRERDVFRKTAGLPLKATVPRVVGGIPY